MSFLQCEEGDVTLLSFEVQVYELWYRRDICQWLTVDAADHLHQSSHYAVVAESKPLS